MSGTEWNMLGGSWENQNGTRNEGSIVVTQEISGKSKESWNLGLKPFQLRPRKESGCFMPCEVE